MVKVFLPLIIVVAMFVGAGEMIHACVENGTGSVRIVEVGSSCDADETALQWGVVGIQGEKGDPGDAVKANPPCFDNANRYVDCGNGTVMDTVTGLVWLKDASCADLEGTNAEGRANYTDANNAAAQLNNGECGLTDNSSPGDWRLPTDEEWGATVERANTLGCTNPSLTDTGGTGCYATGGQPFTGVQSFDYWSSTSNAVYPDYAWFVFLSGGRVYDNTKDFGIYVWPVRGGQ